MKTIAGAAPLEQLFRHDRMVVISAIAAIVGASWAYLLWLGSGMDMSGTGMSGMDMPGMMAPAVMPWGGADFLFMFLMWAVMMVGMMLPSAAPMVLLYARVGRQAHEEEKPFAATGWFAGGYLLAWTAFAFVATASQWALEQAAMMSPLSMAVEEEIGGLLLVAAGLYQWTSFKDVCLSHCRAPLAFIQKNGGFRREPEAALSLGFRHGLYCIGCCWLLMLLLFVGGIMSILWIAGLAAFVLLEKLVASGRGLARVGGTVLIVAGLWLLTA